MPEEFFPELRKVLKHLEDTSPTLRIERERENEAMARKVVSDGRQGWRGGVSVDTYSLSENREGGTFDHRFRLLASANARRPLYHWGALQAESRIAQLGVLVARSDYMEARRRTAQKTRASYLELSLRDYALGLAKDSLKLALENQETAVRKHDLGLVTEVDVAETKIASLRQRIRIFELERDLQAEQRLFAHETGYSEQLNFSIPNNFTQFVTDFSKSRPAVPVGGVVHSGLLENLDHAIAVERERVIVAEAIRKPKINLVGSVYQDQVDALDSSQTLNRTNLVLGVQVQWDIFDGRESEGRKNEALSRQRRLEMTKAYEEQRLLLRRDHLRHDLETRAELVQSRQELSLVSKEKFGKSRTEFEQNRITVEDFFAYRLELDQSRLDLMSSVVDYLSLLGEYLVLHGEAPVPR
ncbi:MAG: TolC family protein [Opitutales bacterium]